MDVLANILGVTQLGNSLLCQSELEPPWGLEVDAYTKAAVHLVQRGVCWLRVDGEQHALRLAPGDVVLVARGMRHTLTDDPKTPAEPYEQAIARMQRRLASRRPSDPSASAVLLCAAYEFAEDGPHPLLALLPRLIHIPVDAADDRGQLQSLVRLLLHEASRNLSGSELVVPRLIDTLLVFIVRAWLEQQPEGGAGWFGALRDPQIGRALALIHEEPARNWSVALLANEVAQSRAAFARRFTALVGEPPLTYVTRWRMNLAVKQLRTTDVPLDSLAAQVGYDSSAAFGKAFTRYLRTSPGRYRAASRSRS